MLNNVFNKQAKNLKFWTVTLTVQSQAKKRAAPLLLGSECLPDSLTVKQCKWVKLHDWHDL